MAKLAIYRDTYLPFSENYILEHQKAIKRFSTEILTRKVVKDLPDYFPNPDFVLQAQKFGKIESLRLKLFRESPDLKTRLLRSDAVLAHFCQDGWRISKTASQIGLPLFIMAHGGDVLFNGLGKPKNLGEYALRGNWQNLAIATKKIIAVSDFVAAALLGKHVPSSKIERIYIGTSEVLDSPYESRIHDILYVGRLSDEKGFNVFLDFVQKSLNEYNIAVVGDGPLRADLMKLINSVPYSKITLKYYGIKSGQETRKIIGKSKTLVIPTTIQKNGESEGLSMVAVEALAAGTPIIASKIGGLLESVGQGGGLLIEPNSTKSIQIAVAELMQYRNWKDISTIGRNVWRDHFDISVNIKDFEDLIGAEI